MLCSLLLLSSSEIEDINNNVGKRKKFSSSFTGRMHLDYAVCSGYTRSDLHIFYSKLTQNLTRTRKEKGRKSNWLDIPRES